MEKQRVSEDTRNEEVEALVKEKRLLFKVLEKCEKGIWAGGRGKFVILGINNVEIDTKIFSIARKQPEI